MCTHPCASALRSVVTLLPHSAPRSERKTIAAALICQENIDGERKLDVYHIKHSIPHDLDLDPFAWPEMTCFYTNELLMWRPL